MQTYHQCCLTRGLKDVYRIFDSFNNFGLTLINLQCNFPPKNHIQLPDLPQELEHKMFLWWLTYDVVTSKHKELNKIA